MDNDNVEVQLCDRSNETRACACASLTAESAMEACVAANVSSLFLESCAYDYCLTCLPNMTVNVYKELPPPALMTVHPPPPPNPPAPTPREETYTYI